MMRWGTGDGINPMDLINPRDYRDPIAGGRSDTRVPILLANGIFLMGPVTVAGVIIPKAEVNKFSLPCSPWEAKGLRELRKSGVSGEITLSPAMTAQLWRYLHNTRLATTGKLLRDLCCSMVHKILVLVNTVTMIWFT